MDSLIRLQGAGLLPGVPDIAGVSAELSPAFRRRRCSSSRRLLPWTRLTRPRQWFTWAVADTLPHAELALGGPSWQCS